MEQHWSHQVSETTLSFSPDCTPGVCPLSIAGGSEYGDFCLVGDQVRHNKIIYHSGSSTKLHSNDVILEVQGQKVAGYTSNDLREWILTAAQNSNPVLIKTAKAGTLKKELRPYLNYGFVKGSVDHDTQMTIRENLFQRTVPCTTRPPREGEVNGVDYTFVSLEEFQALEKSGNLLESGGFDGNFYGMPKPPIVSPTKKKEQSSDIKPGAHPSSKGKRQRNRSTIEATSNKNHPIDNTVHSAHIPGTDHVISTPRRGPSRGPTEGNNERGVPDSGHLTGSSKQPQLAPPSPGHRPLSQPTTASEEQVEDLPPNWEMAYTPEGHVYFIDPVSSAIQLTSSTLPKPIKASTPNNAASMSADRGGAGDRSSRTLHNTETTHWTHPRQAPSTKDSTPQLSPTEDLPYGWEKVEDLHYGVYYIDHLNKKTQYDPPTRAIEHELVSPSPSAKSARSVPSYREPDSVSQQHTKVFFTKNPEELSGETLTTLLTKSLRGFGFTIVGGDERDEEFLQIKNVVPHGPADQDGVLRTGDVLVRVNDQLVLGYTHSDVVSMFQTIQPGEQVHLEICRGYSLAFDPNDPNTEIVTTIAVSMPKLTPAEAKQREVNRATRGHKEDEDGDNSSLNEFADSLLHDLTLNDNSLHSPSTRQGSELQSSGLMFSIEIVRGHAGFGFTIADSVNGQRVKHILDPGRCKTLREGDILVRIAGNDVKEMDHLDVVDVLKSCQQGRPTEIVVQRGGFKKIPRPPSQSRSHEDSNDPSPFSSPELDTHRRMKFITGSDSADAISSDGGVPDITPSHRVIHRPKATSSKPGMFKWTVNGGGSTSQLPRSTLHSTSSLGNKDDDSEGQRTPPPLPSKGRLNSDTTADSKENILIGLPQSYLTEAPSSMVLPSQLRDSTNVLNNNKSPEDKGRPPHSISTSMLPDKQSLGPHPMMNQYHSYYQPQKESFYDVPNKYRSDNGGALTAQQRFDMMAGPPRQPHEFGQPLDAASRAHPQVLPTFSVSNNTQSQPPLDSRRSRTPGPEHMRAPPDRSTDDRFRSKTPNPADHRSRAHSIQNNLNQPPSTAIRGATSFENSTPMPSQPNALTVPPGWREQWTTLDVSLRRGDQGFGFRIVGGPEEGTQVAIGYIVPGGVADSDRRLKTGDDIIRVDDISTIGESHHKVVALMGQASSTGQVNLGIRRRVLVQDTSLAAKTPLLYSPPTADKLQAVPYDVTVTRRVDEGFGFIIVSSVNRVGAVVGRIIDSSPAERCGRLRVGDRILAVNDVDISRMLHEDIVNLIKDSGYSVKLAVAPPLPPSSDKRLNGSMTNATALPSLADNETLVRNMHSHTALGTADRYNGGPLPLQGSKSAGNLSGNQPSQSYGMRSDSRLPSSSSNAPPYDFNTPSYQPTRPLSTYDPLRSTAYDPLPSRQQYDPSPRQTYEPPRPSYEAPRPAGGYDPSVSRPGGYDPSKLGIKTPIIGPNTRPVGNSMTPSAQPQQNPHPSPGSILRIELSRSSRGFGFSIRGGREFNNMPLYVLRIAEEGAAHMDQRLLVGDEILEINDQPTNGMSHAEAINLIQSGAKVKLLVKRTGQLPEQGIPSPQGSGLSSPAIRNTGPTSHSSFNSPLSQSVGYNDPNQNYNKDRYGGAIGRQDSQMDQHDGRYNQPPHTGYRPDVARGAPDLNRGGGPAGVPRGLSVNRGPDINSSGGYASERYNPLPAGGSRYTDPAAQQQQRGYPVGRDSNQGPPPDRLMSTSYPPPLTHQNSVNTRPYNSSNTAPNSGPTGQFNGPSMNASYQQPSSSVNGPQYSNTQNPYQHQPSGLSYSNSNPGYQQPPPAPGGSYNAGAMNRQMNQQMYNYYDRNKPPMQSTERQPPIGQNSFDSRSSVPRPNYPGAYDTRYNTSSTYKPMDYGPQGMIRSNSTAMSSNPPGVYSGQSNGGVTRPSYTNNYNDQPMRNNYYSRQPAAYQ